MKKPGLHSQNGDTGPAFLCVLKPQKLLGSKAIRQAYADKRPELELFQIIVDFELLIGQCRAHICASLVLAVQQPADQSISAIRGQFGIGRAVRKWHLR